MRAPSAVLAFLILVGAPAEAHDFWIDLDAFRHSAPGRTIAIRFMVGEAREPESWTLRPERVVSMRSLGPSGLRDHQAELLARAPLTLAERGTHVFGFETTPAVSVLPAAKFAEYVAHEGLSAVAAHRAATKAVGDGRELYARRAKAVVQVGDKLTDEVLQPLGHSLEILPLTHPHAARNGSLAFRVLFRGRPLAGARFECQRLDDDREMLPLAKTDSDGRAACMIPRLGRWKVSTVWSVPIEDTRRAEYDTLFASLSFGF